MEEILYGFDESKEEPKKKDIITYEPIEKGIRKKLKNGKLFSYEATVDFGREEVYDEKKKAYRQKQNKKNKTFKTLADARKWRRDMETLKDEAKEKKVVFKNEGIRLVDVADDFLALKTSRQKEGRLKKVMWSNFAYRQTTLSDFSMVNVLHL